MGKRRSDMLDIGKNDHQRAHNIHYHHNRDDPLRNHCDTLQTADHHDPDQDHQDDAHDQHIQCHILFVGSIEHYGR